MVSLFFFRSLISDSKLVEEISAGRYNVSSVDNGILVRELEEKRFTVAECWLGKKNVFKFRTTCSDDYWISSYLTTKNCMRRIAIDYIFEK